jgi:DNA mismatch repair protein MutS
MSTPELSRSDSPSTAEVGRLQAESNSGAAVGQFHSILFEELKGAAGLVDRLQEPGFFADLNLDQVLESMTTGHDEYELKPFFYAPLHDVAAVRYRHEVLRDLEKTDVHKSIMGFAEAMRQMRVHLARADKLHYPLQKQAWVLDAIEIYCQAVRMLSHDLAEHDVTSRGFQGLRGYLAQYEASERFGSLTAQTQALKDELAGVRYAVRIQGPRVTVSNYGGEADYGAQVEQTFAKFQEGAVKSYLAKLHDSPDMDHVEAQILDRVANLNPEVFATLADYCARHRGYLDATVRRFDREVQFYLAYLELIRPYRAAGLAFNYPRVSARSKEVMAAETFDIALAGKLVPEGGPVVCNDLYLEEPERVFVVSGANNGGKTTFARTFGQLHYLASLGLLVPGSEARLFLPDRIYTHFEKQEDIETLRGKFDDELVRVHEIIEQASSHSVIIMNESFNSTTLNDALFVGTEVMRRVLELGCLGVYVTFVDEIATLGEETVSMVCQIVPDNPADRTFKVVRKPADGLAYAWAIAEKYGLTEQRLIERIGE